MLQTVMGFFEGFTKKEVEKYNLACKEQTILVINLRKNT